MKDGNESMPRVLVEYIESLTRAMGNGKKIKLEVKGELEAHFEDALESFGSGAEKDEATVKLLEEFGDAETLAKLIKRSKKRCRPLWKKVLVRTGQGLVGLVVLLVVYSVWFLTGDATFSVDYLARLNEMTRPIVLSQDNAWTNYEKAIELYVEPVEQAKEILLDARRDDGYVGFSDLSEGDRALLRECIEQNESAWNEYVAASSKSYCFREYKVGEDAPFLMDVKMPHLTSLRDMSLIGIWRARISMHEGRPMEAAQTCLALLRCGRHWQKDKGTLREQLVGLAIVRVASAEIIYTVAEAELSTEELQRLQQDSGAVFADGFPRITAEFDRVAFTDTVQHIFTKGGPGGGHLIPRNVCMVESGSGPEYAAASLIHARRNSTLAVANKLYDQMDKIVMMSPYERHAANMESVYDVLLTYNQYRYWLLFMMVPGIDRVTDIRYQAKAIYDVVDVVVALKVWELEKGELPGSLAELRDGGFLKELPDDPYSDGALKYVKGDGDFLLYSAGEDFKDNGGKTDPGRLWGDDDQEGFDHVFWPIEQKSFTRAQPDTRRFGQGGRGMPDPR